MTTENSAGSHAGGPGDVPGGRPAALNGLDVLTGRWEMEASFAAGAFGPGSPATTERGGLTTFEWLEGRYFVIQRFEVENPAAPSGIAIIGPGGVPGTLEQHYYDSRGVARVYQASMDGVTWKLWREAPGFWQRYSGVVSEDGSMIAGAWEKSGDGLEWERDFGLTYIKVG